MKRVLADVGPLRHSAPFRRLWIGSTLSAVGSALSAFAIPLQVYEFTRSPFAVGLVGLFQLVPTLAIGLFGGAWADTQDRRTVVLLTSACSVMVSGGLAVQAFAGLHRLAVIYALAAAQSALSAISGPARQTFIPSLLGAEDVAAGLALNRLSFQIMLIVGPAVAGLVAAAPSLGVGACYAVDAVSFAGALYGVAGLPALGRRAAPEGTTARRVAAGVGFIYRTPLVAGAFLADLTATVFALPVALFPAVNAQRFHGDPRTLGLFTAAIGVGGMCSAVLSGPLARLVHQGRAMLGSVSLWGAAFAGFALVPGLWPTLALLAVAGAADTVTVVLRGTIVQVGTPDRLRGRVSAAEYVAGVTGSQLGNLEAGAVGSLASPTVSAFSGGLLTLAGALVIGVSMRGFRDYRAAPRQPATSDG